MIDGILSAFNDLWYRINMTWTMTSQSMQLILNQIKFKHKTLIALMWRWEFERISEWMWWVSFQSRYTIWQLGSLSVPLMESNSDLMYTMLIKQQVGTIFIRTWIQFLCVYILLTWQVQLSQMHVTSWHHHIPSDDLQATLTSCHTSRFYREFDA